MVISKKVCYNEMKYRYKTERINENGYIYRRKMQDLPRAVQGR